MSQASQRQVADRDPDLLRPIQDAALAMTSDKEFPALYQEAIKHLREAGLDFYALSLYLFALGSETEALHYSHNRGELGWLRATLSEEEAEYWVYANKEAHSWEQAQSEPPISYLCLSTAAGVVTIAAERDRPYTAAEQALLEAVVPVLELLAVRHRDLSAYATVDEAYHQTRSRLITSNPDLMALHDGSFDLSGESADAVALLILEFIARHLGLDRGGIFLREGDLLRGFWGMDEQGRTEEISRTVFPVYPQRPEDLTHTALIARGEEQYYLTQDLGAEGGPDNGANIAVPMRVGDRIVGVLVADNLLSGRSIPFDQVQALMVLANQGAAALERARLYQDLQRFNEELEQRVGERTAKLARTNGQLHREIAERERIAEALQASLGDKDMLFREVHHRVKNNLQTISSLLSLQADFLDDSQALAALEASRSRVEAMGRIHQQLYQGDDWAQVDFDAFLAELVEDLFETYRVGAVRLEVVTESVHCDVDQSVPCCLLINELVTNALKHAFPAGRPGRVRVAVRALGDGRLQLEVADDGVGFPAGLDFRRTESLGLQIAVSLVKNIEGQIEMRSEGAGTTFTVVFPPRSS